MVLDSLYKLNAFDSNSIALSEIISNESDHHIPSIGEIQRKFGDLAPLAFEQIKLKKKAWRKLPIWCTSGCLFEQRALEQSTSERVAIWKASHFKTKKVLSLTGGLGVDDWAFSRQDCDVTSVDTNEALNQLVRHNMQLLQQSWSRVEGDALSFISKADSDTLVYIDPDRRLDNERLGGDVNSYSPNIQKIFKKAPEGIEFLIKFSPMTDYKSLLELLPSGQICIYSIHYQHEVKELLIQIDRSQKPMTSCISVHLGSSENEIELIHEHHLIEPLTPRQELYIFEPHGGLNVVGLQHTIASRSDMNSLVHNHTLFSTYAQIPKAWGRSKRVIKTMEGSLKEVKRSLSKSGYTTASVTTKGSFNWKGRRVTGDTLRKELNLIESDTFTLYVIPLKNSNKISAWLTVTTY